MRLVTFGEELSPGVLVGEGIIDASPVLKGLPVGGPEDGMLSLIASFVDLRKDLERLCASAAALPPTSVRLRAPVPRPGKILAAVGNFTEFGQREVQPIDWFFKSPESVVGTGDPIVLPPHPARVFHHEAEIGVVIGRPCRNVAPDEAADYVFGYTNFIDVSARDLGRPRVATFFGKSFDTFGPMGPWLVTADEVADPYALHVRLSVNGEVRQDYPLSDIAHRIPELIAHASAIMTLLPGDLIACGTNHHGLGPLQHGDFVEMEITSLGRLQLSVSDPLRRRWSREDRGSAIAGEAAQTERTVEGSRS